MKISRRKIQDYILHILRRCSHSLDLHTHTHTHTHTHKHTHTNTLQHTTTQHNQHTKTPHNQGLLESVRGAPCVLNPPAGVGRGRQECLRGTVGEWVGGRVLVIPYPPLPTRLPFPLQVSPYPRIIYFSLPFLLPSSSPSLSLSPLSHSPPTSRLCLCFPSLSPLRPSLNSPLLAGEGRVIAAFSSPFPFPLHLYCSYNVRPLFSHLPLPLSLLISLSISSFPLSLFLSVFLSLSLSLTHTLSLSLSFSLAFFSQVLHYISSS